MSAPVDTETDILIAGAGPTGLVLALWLAHWDVRVRIIDKTKEPGTTSRALAVQARTLELYAQIGLAGAVMERCRPALAANLWVTGKKRAHLAFGDMGAGISPYPYPVIFPQDEHERLLIDRLSTAGVNVDRATELLSFEMTADHVVARLKKPDGTAENLPGRLHCGLRRGAFDRARGAGDRFCRRAIRAHLLCRRRRRDRLTHERRIARGARQERFSGTVPA
jgi:2-polyprenyl-6-methoxyphenol hydroxylase-like FAD-dependent oxidoreductase